MLARPKNLEEWNEYEKKRKRDLERFQHTESPLTKTFKEAYKAQKQGHKIKFVRG